MCKISKSLDIFSKSFDVSEPRSMFHNVSTKIILWHDLFDLFQSFFTLLYLVFLFGWKKMMLMMPTGSALNYLPTIAKKVCFQGSQIQTNLVFVLFPQQFEVFIFLHHHHPLLFHHHLFFINFTMRTNTFAFAALENFP